MSNQTLNQTTPLGIIEGFYGRVYTVPEREFLLRFAGDYGYSFYIVAPKNIRCLRQDFLKGPSEELEKALKAASTLCHHSLDLKLGLGLSPYNLTLSYKEHKERFLRLCRDYVAAFDLDILAILFDDVAVQSQTVGLEQSLIVNDVVKALSGTSCKVMMCPAYYTFDPILERLFDARPEHYFDEIKENLDEGVSIFWTGNKVLSEDITQDDIERAAALTCHKIALWDNYPVNDGKKSCKFLKLAPFQGRRDLKPCCHAVNPLVEPYLSAVPLMTLPLVYQGLSPDAIKEEHGRYLKALLAPYGSMVLEHLNLFTQEGLEAFDEDAKQRFLKLAPYSKPFEILQDYLKGEYAFDPLCLT